MSSGEASITRTQPLGLVSTTTIETDALSGIENLTGNSGSDRLIGDGLANKLDGGAGDDGLAGLGGADRIFGGDGIDTADYSGSDAGVTVELSTGTATGGHATGDTLSSVENVADRLMTIGCPGHRVQMYWSVQMAVTRLKAKPAQMFLMEARALTSRTIATKAPWISISPRAQQGALRRVTCSYR